ncbi:MAG: bifunctional [glutamate--ammonia ligase]-adenylyl-L-tyrosine phosphorylase/[glutamate--ammonia-ligase] adenylyltransferase, partial [Planctomycetes bacterium]|nr:bifunctional [glutamate--ammonia ligase]-adenylyl-L-tyrosine phosphorylase/[glutamate--ammonia-ligase] adenylyltransferase [Planctomycetota bacterium]
DRFATLSPELGRFLPRQADPDMALNNLERFFTNPLSIEQIPKLLEERARGLETLLQLFSTSQFFSDLLANNIDFLDVVHGPLRPSPTLDELIEELDSRVRLSADDASVLRVFRRFRQRQHLRIGVNDIIRDRPLEEITHDLSAVAEASIEVALRTAIRGMGNRFGLPRTASGEESHAVVLGFGKLGGNELNYSSDIDLMLIFDEDGRTNGQRTAVANDEFWARVVAEFIRLLSAHTDRGQAYRVDLRLRPEGKRGPVARSLASTLSYYDTLGRTWERQALIKVRPVAGDRTLGDDFLRSIEGFVWRKYLTFAEINEIKAMKRRIEQNAHRTGEGERDVKTGQGGIRDVEFTIQFLQLLNGGDLNRLRERSTLIAMHALESAGCLTDPEYRALDDAYRFLRKAEHRLQLMFDWQTHRLPDRPEELRKLALRMGYSATTEPRKSDSVILAPGEIRLPNSPQRHSRLDEPPLALSLQTRDLLLDPLEQFLHDYFEKTKLNRTILDHLLHQTFPDSETEGEPESDLILAPEADEAAIRTAMSRYSFKDLMGAHRNLLQLAQEAGPFLSTRRCRHFLASIAPQLLRAVAETPDPDLTLVNLEQVTASLGAKAILWELFSFHPASLKLYVDLCSNSSFLSQILINNPGMIDDLLDSLILNQPRTLDELRAELKELGRGVERWEVIEPILRSFQDKELLRIGVRDLLDKDDIRATTAALSDLAEAILTDIAARQEPILALRHGIPILHDGPRAGEPSRYVLLALGKLGGREMSYHSDLDLVLVYEGDGSTDISRRGDSIVEMSRVDNFHFFTELARRIIKSTSQPGPLGQLYAVDMRLRPTGKSGSLVIPLTEFNRYYNGPAMIWERQALSRARCVHGDPEFANEVLNSVHRAVHGIEWRPEFIDDIRAMRERLEANSSPRSLKRAPGCMVDVEFLVQMFQIKYGERLPSLLHTNAWEALDALLAAELLDEREHRTLFECYSFLRFAEARLRVVTNRPLTEYPEDPEELEKFARRLGMGALDSSAAQHFLDDLQKYTSKTRMLFLKLMEREKQDPRGSQSLTSGVGCVFLSSPEVRVCVPRGSPLSHKKHLPAKSTSAGRIPKLDGKIVIVEPLPDRSRRGSLFADSRSSGMIRRFLAVCLLLILPMAVSADEKPLRQIIDAEVKAAWQTQKVTPAPRSDDATFLRRVYFDVVGTIPTYDETVAFLKDTDPAKREKLIDKLLADPRFASHEANVWDLVFFGRNPSGSDTLRKREPFKKWLAEK